MFCSRCGIQVVEGKRFCQACGQEVGAAVTATAAIAGALSHPVAGTARVSTPLPYGGFWARFVASVVDGLILVIPFWLVVIALIFMFGGFGMMLHRNPVDPRAAALCMGAANAARVAQAVCHAAGRRVAVVTEAGR